MATRRQEKVARVVKEAVSTAVMHHLNDPRIEGFVSITKVEMAPDLRNAFVYLSIFGSEPAVQNRTFTAIEHAKIRIQSFVARGLHSKFCPVLHFRMDEHLKKSIETMNLINEASEAFRQDDPEEDIVRQDTT